jgi:aryl-alcohol dehydrogenase-like predicted oxidoreductase
VHPASGTAGTDAQADAPPLWLAVRMDYRPLGTTGVQVSRLCLGAMMFGAWGNPDHDESVRIIHRAVDAGINFIDTADMYSFGESEEIVGKALQGLDREHIVLATKVHGPMSGDPNAQGNSRRWVIAECEHSLRRLGTDYLDLYQIHRPSLETDIDDTLGALSDLVHAGKIRYAGCSTFPAHQVVESHWVAERRGHERFRTEQPQYSMLARDIEADLLPVCQQYGMGVLSWSPLAGGWLSGAFGEGKENTSRRSAMLPERYDLTLPMNRLKLAAVIELQTVADEAGHSLLELALAFVQAHPAITCPIIGPRTMQQLESQLVTADITLGDDVLDSIDEIAPPGQNVGGADPGWAAPSVTDKRLRRR